MASCPSASGSLHAQPGRGFQVLEVYGRGWGLRRPWRNREPRSPRESRVHSRYLKPSCESPPFFSATSLDAHLFYHSDKKRESRMAATASIKRPKCEKCSGVRENELLHVFLTVLNDAFRSFIHVFTRLKERVFQRPQQLDIALVGLAQHATQSLERLLSHQRDHRGVDRIIHDRLLCFVGKLRRWHPGNNPGNTHACHDFPACHVSHDLTWPPRVSLACNAALCCERCRSDELLICLCKLL